MKPDLPPVKTMDRSSTQEDAGLAQAGLDELILGADHPERAQIYIIGQRKPTEPWGLCGRVLFAFDVKPEESPRMRDERARARRRRV